MPLPNFIIAGAPKCGTTALWALLRQHPEICLAGHKEPRFFSRINGDLERGIMGDGHNRSGRFNMGFNWYERLFDECSGAKAIGEASTHYFSASDSAALIAKHLPNVRLILMLRDPVERAYSHYWQEHKLGWHLPPFEEMVATEHPRLRFYVNVSHYRVHLERFSKYVDPSRMLVMLNEDMVQDTSGFLRTVFDFLGVDLECEPNGGERRFNPQTTPRSRCLARASERLRWQVADHIPPWSRRVLGRCKRVVDNINARKHWYNAPAANVREELIGRFTDDVDYVEGLLRRDLESWRRSAPL